MRRNVTCVLTWVDRIPPAVLLALGLALAVPGAAAAQDDDVDWGFQGEGGDEGGEGGGGDPADTDGATAGLDAPGRVLARLGAGVGLRLGTDDQYDQTAVAPAFLEAMGGYVFSGAGRWRHGAVLGVATGLTADGPPAAEIGAFGQYRFTLGYLAYFRFGMDMVVGARIGPSFAIGFQDAIDSLGRSTTDFVWSWGGEVAGHVQYMLLAGFGLYADVSVAIYAGAANSVHPIVGVSGGVVLDYELLP